MSKENYIVSVPVKVRSELDSENEKPFETEVHITVEAHNYYDASAIVANAISKLVSLAIIAGKIK